MKIEEGKASWERALKSGIEHWNRMVSTIEHWNRMENDGSSTQTVES
jgi:hypothetical protein